jgi:MFS family permease
MTTSARSAGPGTVRWRMLAVISLGIAALTLNWFDVATAFPLIGSEFKVGLGSLSYLISLYIVGYGLAHIPGGMLATALGMKKTLAQGLAGIMSGLSYSYTELACCRVVSGIGGSVFIAVGTAAVVVWFREKTSRSHSASPAAPFSAQEPPARSMSGSTCSVRRGGTRHSSWPVSSGCSSWRRP